jgi:hypothetical protein
LTDGIGGSKPSAGKKLVTVSVGIHPKNSRKKEEIRLPQGNHCFQKKGYLIQVEPLKKTIEAVLLSAYIKNEKPISLLIVAKPESGKTSVMALYKKTKGVVLITDCTAHGIQRDILPQIVNGEIKTIMIPDLTTPLAKPTKTRQALVALFNNLIEEGVAKVTTYVMTWEREVKANLITALTKDTLEDERHKWGKMGFTSRFLCFSYKYDNKTVNRILESYSEHGLKFESVNLKVPKKPVDITLSKEMADRLNPMAKKIGKRFELYGIRAKINLRVLLKALSLRNGHDQVTEADYRELLELSKYFNFQCRGIEQ